ncbi:hypothetical protein MAFF241647_25070 [Ralstonia solanacearum]|nr:hypothetical protein CFM90_11105 [Ralstonia solanacearum]BCM08150.1 hypothetical protein MAFF241647_25070 [Ralstonia solanacearum]
MQSMGRQTFDTLCVEIARLEAAHPDRAIVLIEIRSSVAVSSMSRGPLLRKSILESLSLHPDGTIWFNVVLGTRDRSAGTWSASTMRLDVSEQARVDLVGIAVPERVQITEV